MSIELVTYSEMASRHGKRAAYNLLRSVETLAQIHDEIASTDVDARFQRAIRALSNIDFAARP